MKIIWETTLDDIYDCEVTRQDDSTGILTIKTKNIVVYSCAVNLSFGSIFGPDVHDVAEWESICIDYADNRSK